MKDQRTTIVPMLSIRNGMKAVAFYKAAFGAEELFRISNDKGEVVARLSVQGAEFWLADESPAHLNFSPESLGGGTVRWAAWWFGLRNVFRAQKTTRRPPQGGPSVGGHIRPSQAAERSESAAYE